MWHEQRQEANFFWALAAIDEIIAEQVRAAGCPCGGRLHRADYPRKTRGLMKEAEPAFARRISFCCAREGCRARTLPASVCFLGRKVYAAAIVLIACAVYCQLRATEKASRAAAQVARAVEMPVRTLRRAAMYFTEILPALAGFHAERGRFMPPVDEALLPLSLLERFAGSPSEKLVATLQFVARVATSPPRARIPMPE